MTILGRSNDRRHYGRHSTILVAVGVTLTLLAAFRLMERDGLINDERED